MARTQSPRSKKKPKGGKKVRTEHNPSSFDQKYVSWGLRFLDKDGRWGWKSLDASTWWQSIYPKLQSFESMAWSAVKNKPHPGNHYVSVDTIIQEAKVRLRKLRLDDHDQIFSLHLSGKQRIYGILTEGILKVLWYDPEHEICPSNKKHT